LVDYASSTRNTPRPFPHPFHSRQSLRDDDISFLLNYGSEEEGEGEEEDDIVSIPVPRRLRVDFEEDQESEPPQEQLLDCFLPIATEEPVMPRSISPSLSPSSLHRDNGTELGEYKPTDRFEFQWQAFPENPIPPNLRRETFVNNNLGPGVHYAHPYDAFIAIWDRQIMIQICEQTNLYVQQMTEHLLATGSIFPRSRITQWKDINIDELILVLYPERYPPSFFG
ncbi:hypothetical protein evm_015625, partial [Chilo suppressalis]